MQFEDIVKLWSSMVKTVQDQFRMWIRMDKNISSFESDHISLSEWNGS